MQRCTCFKICQKFKRIFNYKVRYFILCIFKDVLAFNFVKNTYNQTFFDLRNSQAIGKKRFVFVSFLTELRSNYG